MAVSPHHLVLLPLASSVSVAEALAAIGRLQRASPLEVLDTVVIERREDGTVAVAPTSPPVGTGTDVAAWSWLLDAILDRPQSAGGAERVGGPLRRTGLSESFVAEVVELLATPGKSLVLIVSGLDPGAAVSELRGFQGTRLVYGAMPGRVIERMLTRPTAAPRAPFET